MGAYDTMKMLESLRKKILAFQYMYFGLLALSICMPVITGEAVFAYAICIAGVVSALYFARNTSALKAEYKNIYKNTFVKSMLGSMLDNVEYDWRRGFLGTEVIQFGIVRMGNCFNSEDYISAEYRNVKFRQADVVIKNVRGSGRNRRVETYFQGRMFEFNYQSKLVSNVKIFSKAYVSRLNLNDNRVEMEDVDFNTNFNVYSAAPHDAYYILTPPMMEKLRAVSRRYENIAFRFAPGKLYVGINTYDSFDAGVTRKLSFPEEQARMKKDVQVIIDIIEMIDLIRDAEYNMI